MGLDTFSQFIVQQFEPSLQNIKENIAASRKEIMPEVADGIIDAGENATGRSSEKMRRILKAFIMRAAPAVVFGFIDNFIMVMAGNQIDATIKAALGLGTMAAAGLGNALSDAVGVAAQERIESALGKIGLGGVELQGTAGEKLAGLLGGIFGITVGCLLGMIPVFFGMRTSSKEREMNITEKLDGIAEKLESAGLIKEAAELDVISNSIEKICAQIDTDMRQELGRLGLNVSLPYNNKGQIVQDVSFPNGLFMVIAMPSQESGQQGYTLKLFDKSRKPLRLPQGRYFVRDAQEIANTPQELYTIARILSGYDPKQIEAARPKGRPEMLRGRTMQHLKEHYEAPVEGVV